MAAYLGLAERTVRERIKKMGGEFTLDKGMVHLEPKNTDLDPDF